MTTAERNAATRRIEYLDEQIAELHVDHSFAAECGDRRSVKRAGARIFRLEAERSHLLLKFPEIKYDPRFHCRPAFMRCGIIAPHGPRR